MKYLLYILFFASVLLTGCSGSQDNEETEEKETVDIPIEREPEVNSYNGFTSSSPLEAGLNPMLLDTLSTKIRAGQYANIHSLLIIRRGKLAFEEYYNGSFADERHKLESVTKSITAALIGIAIDKGYISSLDTPLKDILKNYDISDSIKERITLRHLLTMKTGLSLGGSPTGDDWVGSALSKPLKSQPGSEFEYSTFAALILAGVIEESTGMKTEDFARQYLFNPLGITSDEWFAKDKKGHVHTGGALKMTARDMARFGLLYLNKGKWGNDRVLSENWVNETFTQTQGAYYGLMWWISSAKYKGKRIKVLSANGKGGQYVFVIPDLDMIVVSTAWNEGKAKDYAKDFVKDYIVPAAE